MRKMIKLVELYILDEYGSASAERFRDLIEGDEKVFLQDHSNLEELDGVLDLLIGSDIFSHTVEYNELVELQEAIKLKLGK